MKRTSTDAEYLDSGKVVIDADGIPVDVPDRTHMEAADQALGVRVDAAHWYRGALGASDDLDSFTRISHQGLRRVTPSVGNGPGLPGWVETTYDTNTARTRQVFTSSSPSDAVSLERKYSGGVWGEWTPVTWHGVVVTSGSADDLIRPHAYSINSTSVGNLPVAFLGTLETLPAGSGLSSLVQRFTSRESSPRTWTRSRTAGTWSPWVEALRHDHVDTIIDNKLDAQSRMSMDAVETSQSGGSVIVQSMSLDGRVGYNALSPTVRQTFDHGTTWEDVNTFSGNNVEWVRALPSGELMVETTGWVNGVSGVRRVWVSTGYTPQKPASATWEVTLTAAAPLVKFADWSISITDEMILLAEYGPKSGMVWGSGTDIIPEGQNARYVYQSLDNGKTWSRIFDLNTFLTSNGRPNADRQHLHGVAWDKWWQRIWVSFGDASGDGTNGVLYSDDRGATWKAAYWTHTHPSTGWQVVGIQPMKDCVLFAGDMTPSGVIRLDRAQGKNSFVFETGWDFSETDKHLCHVISYQEGAFGEVALFAFAREGTASPSFIVGTRDGYLFDILWQESGTSLPGIRSVAGPSADGTVIAAHSTPSGWVEVKGRLVFPGQVGEVRAVESMIHAVLNDHEARHRIGTGSPEGKITATIGTQYTDEAATNGAIRWIKTSGTGVTGWTVEYGDTGLRELFSATHGSITSGRILIRRFGAIVYLYVNDVQFSTPTPGFGALPSGFRGDPVLRPGVTMSGAWPTVDGSFVVSTLGYLNFYRVPTDKPVSGVFTYSTREAWPTTLPGTPA